MKSATDAATGGVLYRQEIMFSEILQNSQGSTYARVSFLIKLKADPCNFIRKETLAQVFSSEFCEITKNTFFTEHVWATLTNSRNFSSFFFSSSSNSRNFSMSSNFSKQIQSGLKAALWLAFTVSFISVSSFKTLYWNSTYLKKKIVMVCSDMSSMFGKNSESLYTASYMAYKIIWVFQNLLAIFQHRNWA